MADYRGMAERLQGERTTILSLVRLPIPPLSRVPGKAVVSL